jgi:hypothetical protein
MVANSGYASPRSVIAVSVVLPVLAVVAVSLRLYTRRRQKQPLLLDDWYVPSFIPRFSVSYDYRILIPATVGQQTMS